VADTDQVTTDPEAVTTATGERVPTIVVDDIHVIYRVHGATAPGTNSVVALRRILTGKRAPSVREVHAIKGVSLVAYRGEAIGLVGSNGSGKSTLLRAIAGLLPVNRGRVSRRCWA
jgi:teichoic acid transport system ATP-binding protein